MFEEKIKNFICRIDDMKENINTEEATKTSLIMPFFSILGYDVFNPLEFIPEYTADVGIKKGEKVDYAIVLNNEPTILIEAKSITEKLEKHDSQLFRYFATSKAKFAILTNGVYYNFYTDLDEPNKMDSTPFLTVNLLDLRDSDITELKKFQKEKFDVTNILNTASDLKYTSLIKTRIKEEFADPSEKLVKMLITSDVYEGRFTQTVTDKFKLLIKKSFSQCINEMLNDKLKNALNNSNDLPEEPADVTVAEPEDENAIITTDDEIQSYYIVKSIIAPIIEPSRITYKDTQSYFGILIDGKVTKWVCRVFIKERLKYVVIANQDKNEKYTIETLDDIYALSDNLKNRVKELTETE